MKSPLTYYHDESMTKRIAVNESGQPIIDWGETIPGKLKEKTIFVKNESKDRLVVRQPFSTDESLSIVDYPPRLFSAESGAVKLQFKPDENRIESHHGTWGFEVVIG